MHACLLSLILVVGADPQAANYGSAAAYGPTPAAAQGQGSSGCDSCDGAGGHGHGHNRWNNAASAYRQSGRPGTWFGSMPQTCYSPRYGCYPGNSRDIQRYPAFHGTYYRAPYNYRNLFDYPWHAELHEPTSFFSYNVEAERNNLTPRPGAGRDLPPTPPVGMNPRSVISPSTAMQPMPSSRR